MSGSEHNNYIGWLRHAFGNVRMAFVDAPRRGALRLLTKFGRLTQPQRSVVLGIMGITALSLVAMACSQFGVNFATAAFVLLIVVAGLSLLDGFIWSAVFPVIAATCLSFFVIEPRYTFAVGDVQQVTALARISHAKKCIEAENQP